MGVPVSELDPNVILPSLIAGYAAIKAAQAAKFSKPTGNGFAGSVTRSLERIEKRLDEHLRDHTR
jgi:hypothetical protein